MLLVILGAGASHDLALPTTPSFDTTLVPPLTDDLLADTDANRRILAELPGHAKVQAAEEQNGPLEPAYPTITLAHWLLLPQLQLA